jgi:hypothetical protein
MQKTRWLSVDTATALIAIVVFSAYGLYGSTMESTLGVDFVGPDFFPKAVGVFAVGVALLILIQDRRRRAADGGSANALARFSAAAFVPVGLMVVYALTFTWLGFPVSTALFLLLSARYLGCPSWLGATLFGFGGTLAAVLLFIYGLHVRLPPGVLGKFW